MAQLTIRRNDIPSDGSFALCLPIDILLKEDYIYMGTIIIIGVMVAFLAAIFAAGYDDKPGVNNK